MFSLGVPLATGCFLLMSSALATLQTNGQTSDDELARALACIDETDATAVLCLAMTQLFAGSIALVSSFGTESAVLLDLAAEIDRATPVVFLDTGKLFPETLAYRDALIDRLGLTDVRIVTPASLQIATHDANGALWRQNADRCCTLRKTLPLQAVLGGFSAWITGRKRFQAKGRGALQVFEREPSGRVKVNPLAHWTEQRIARHFASRDLPRHPLEAYGFASIGCATCTLPVAPGADRRSGRWPGTAKTECGIHQALPAQG
jgi:phosphoadenosine phosphosulfate reductase